MSKLEKLKERAKALESKGPRAAVDAWIEVLKAQDGEGEPNPDLSIYNRIGDLFLKIRDPGQAADYYDRAVDRYAELGFYNNAIAMCNKVLRNAPARQATYLKLAKLYAAKGFFGEARQNFVEYAGRMQKAGRIDQAFAALRELTDIAPESAHLRELLEEHMKAYGEAGARAALRPRDGGTGEKDDITKSGKRKSSKLVFLDLDEPPRPAELQRPSSGGASIVAPPPRPEPDESLEIESTSLAEDAAGREGGDETLDGLELTSTDFGSVRDSAVVEPSMRDEPPAADVDPMAGLEPTVQDDDEDEAPSRPPPPRMPTLRPVQKSGEGPPRVKPVQPLRPAGPPSPAAPPPRRKAVVEIPPLELEPDFDAGAPGEDDEPAREPSAMDDVGGTFLDTRDDGSLRKRRSGEHLDLGVEGIVNQGDLSASLMFDSIQATPEALTIEELEGRVADDPDDPEAHLALGEALIEVGDRERGIEELDHATNGFEGLGDGERAHGLVDEILRLDPNSIRHRQKMVEFAFKAGDKPRLIEAYLELADTLLRADLQEKARAVYERVAEHDTGNARAREALAMLAPAEPPPATEGRVKARDAKMTVRDSSDPAGDFVDLGAMILEESEPSRDTRMKVEEEEPTGDEERDFQDMLARFKQGIDENIDEGDFQSHYDLGVAFKEMGLLDEAIAELQKALRAPEGKLRTSEALGVCFFEKGAFTVTESVLRRGLELPASGDQERLGILYWLGRALEAQGHAQEARELYGRVFAVDIRFRDVGQRVKALAGARR